jgi:hypothetical protein
VHCAGGIAKVLHEFVAFAAEVAAPPLHHIFLLFWLDSRQRQALSGGVRYL